MLTIDLQRSENVDYKEDYDKKSEDGDDGEETTTPLGADAAAGAGGGGVTQLSGNAATMMMMQQLMMNQSKEKSGSSSDKASAFSSLFKSLDELSLSGLLNVLDGMLELSGAIVVMTTNHPEHLDVSQVFESLFSLSLIWMKDFLNVSTLTLIRSHSAPVACTHSPRSRDDATLLWPHGPCRIDGAAHGAIPGRHAACRRHDGVASPLAH